MESNGFRLSSSKAEYLECKFKEEEEGTGNKVTTSGIAIMVEKFKYLGSVIHGNGKMTMTLVIV